MSNERPQEIYDAIQYEEPISKLIVDILNRYCKLGILGCVLIGILLTRFAFGSKGVASNEEAQEPHSTIEYEYDELVTEKPIVEEPVVETVFSAKINNAYIYVLLVKNLEGK